MGLLLSLCTSPWPSLKNTIEDCRLSNVAINFVCRRLETFLSKTSANAPRFSVPPMMGRDGPLNLFSFPKTGADEKDTLIDISMGSFMVCATASFTK
jgi:hypothetical protein